MIMSVSNVQIGKMLKPQKWQAFFDCDGKVSGFHKALKLIILGVCLYLQMILLAAQASPLLFVL